MGKPKSSLTQPPTNLKEAVDFIAAVGGGFGTTNLPENNYTKVAVALKELKGFNETAQKMLKISEYDSIISELAKGLGYGFLGYTSQGGTDFNGRGIAKSGYQSSYHNANWVQSDASTYAKIFLFLAPLVYYFVSFFYWMCKNKWKNKTIQNIGIVSSLFYLFNAMGFPTTQLNTNKTGDTIAKHLEGHDCFDELSAAYETDGKTSYDAFLQQLEANVASSPLNHPLASCYKLAKEYFESQANAGEITQAMQKIRETLINHSKNTSSDFVTLKSQIADLLQKVKKFNPDKEAEKFGQGIHHAAGQAGKEGENSISAQPSPAGPVAATLTTFGVGGGAAAAYLFNLGGAKTLVKGLFRIG